MKNVLKKMLPYLLTAFVIFCILPSAGKYWGGEMFLMLISLPCTCLIISFVYGAKNGFQLIFPVLIGVLFLPAVFIFYNYTAWIYAVIFAIVALIGNALGRLFYKPSK